jgi:hypothetical protein
LTHRFDEEAMRLNLFAAVLAAASAVALLLPADPAAAAAKKKYVVSHVAPRSAKTTIVSRDENGRTRTRVIIQQRSFLDGGTEVLPGERKFTDYAIPPNYSVTGVIDNTSRGFPSRLPGTWDLPGKNSPGPFW